MPTTLIKLGGSVVTTATTRDHVNLTAIRHLARELAAECAGCVLVHGTGLIGKPPAVRHGYWRDGIIGPDRRLLALRIKHRLRRLNLRFCAAFLAAGVPCLPLPVETCFPEALSETPGAAVADLFRALLGAGVVPVLYGDLMPRRDGSFHVLSSDTIMLMVAALLRPDHVLFLTDVDGVLEPGTPAQAMATHRVMAVISAADRDRLQTWDSASRDVSGGMSGKIAAALQAARFCRVCRIANGLKPGVLTALLQGRTDVGTLVCP